MMVSDFARSRDPNAGQMSRLYSIESSFTITGSMADHRLPTRSAAIAAFAHALADAIAGKEVSDRRSSDENRTPHAPREVFPRAEREEYGTRIQRFLDAAVGDLKKHRGECVMVAGQRQPPGMHALVCQMNEALGNVGKVHPLQLQVVLADAGGSKQRGENVNQRRNSAALLASLKPAGEAQQHGQPR